jgi:hypothetical protein
MMTAWKSGQANQRPAAFLRTHADHQREIAADYVG